MCLKRNRKSQIKWKMRRARTDFFSLAKLGWGWDPSPFHSLFTYKNKYMCAYILKNGGRNRNEKGFSLTAPHCGHLQLNLKILRQFFLRSTTHGVIGFKSTMYTSNIKYFKVIRTFLSRKAKAKAMGSGTPLLQV